MFNFILKLLLSHTWHRVPEYPGEQVHMNELMTSCRQLAPFSQGSGLHSFTSVSQYTPKNVTFLQYANL